MMNGGFTKGMVIGSIIGASVGMAFRNDRMMSGRRRRMMYRSGRSFLRRSGEIIGGVIDALR